MGSKKRKDMRTELLYVRMTASQKAALAAEAEARYRDMSSLMRLIVFAIKTKGRQEKPVPRPALVAGEPIDADVGFRMTREEMGTIKRAAAKRNRKIGNLIVAIIFGVDLEPVDEPLRVLRARMIADSEQFFDPPPERSVIREPMGKE